jgi:hypothetical protein
MVLQPVQTATQKENISCLFIDDPNVFVAGDLFWYPVEGDNKTVYAPDVMVVFGRPKGDRMSYMQWRENNIPPQVVFEILSPSNTKQKMEQKFLFYQKYGVEEYYTYDPFSNCLQGWIRNQNTLDVIPRIADWVSPRLQVHFVLTRETLELYHPDGAVFTTQAEVVQELKQTKQARLQAEQARENAVTRLLAIGLSLEQVAEALGFSIAQVQALINSEA